MSVVPELSELKLWADPTVVQINRLAMRSPFTSQASQRVSLNGEWRFSRFVHPTQIELEHLAENFDDSDWFKIPVPSNWTLFNMGDVPHYTNIAMPWREPPPFLPPELPTAVYRRSFSIDSNWSGKRIILHVGAAESVHSVRINGEFVGYGTDSRLASEYDISSVVREGANVVAITVCRYSAQSYVEDQDQWWMAGLHREIFVEAQSPFRIEDVRVDARVSDVARPLLRQLTQGFQKICRWLPHCIQLLAMLLVTKLVSRSASNTNRWCHTRIEHMNLGDIQPTYLGLLPEQSYGQQNYQIVTSCESSCATPTTS